MRLIIAALFCLLPGTSYAQLPPPFATNPDAVTDVFEWPPVVANDLATNPSTTAGNDGPTGFWLDYSGKPPSVYTLRTLGPAIVSHITSKQWAIVGHIKYWNVAAGSFLELENWFAPEKPGGPELYYYSRTLAEAGPLSKIEGSDDGHDFALPFDSTGAKTSLVRLVLKLHLAGSGRLGFSNVRLVQYPDATPEVPSGALPVSRQDQIIPEGEVLNWLNFPPAYFQPGGHPPPFTLGDPGNFAKITYTPEANPQYYVLKIKYSGLPDPYNLQVLDLSGVPPYIKTKHYAILGDLRYENVSSGSYLEMASFFDSPAPGYPGQWDYSRTLAENGPTAKLEGTHDWRGFWLPFDASNKKGKLTDIRLNLQLTGAGTVYLRNLKLVEYPDALTASSTPPPYVAAHTNPSTSKFGLDGRSFGLGLLTALAALFVGMGLFKLARRFRGLRHARELRRIASLDV